MVNKQVRIVVEKTGRIRVDFKGFQGNYCFIAAEEIYEHLRNKFGVNVKIEYIEKKPEAFVEERAEEKVTW